MDEQPKENLTIIDGSSLIYSACHNVSNKENTDDFSQYKQTLEYYIDNILTDTKANKYIIFGDQNGSYRKRLFESFKANRIKRPYLKFMFDLREYANTNLNFFSHPDLEADDLCLLMHNKYQSQYAITIASKDSDLRQYSARFFNYGIYRTPDYNINDGFEFISPRIAYFNLWKSVLIKGHNNKFDYLDGCGEITAESYLEKWNIDQYPFAVLKAFIYGISKDKKVKRSINGYGLNKGIDKFNKSFKQTYLFRNMQEVLDLDIDLEFPELLDYSSKTKTIW